jgi:DNA-binding CsgD family transcriptional regulator
MSHSQRLRLRDVRAVFRLVGEVRELGEYPFAWPLHLVEGLLRLVGAKRGIALEASTTGPGGMPIPVGVADLGRCDERERQMLVKYNADPGHLGSPEWPSYLELLKERPFFIRCRRQLLVDREWYSSLHVQEVRYPCRVDDFLFSNARLGPGFAGVHVVCLHREWGDKPFEPSQLRLVHLLHDELRRCWQPDPAAGPSSPWAELAPRLQQTLARLLAGDSEKQAARHLGISRNTVHHYVVDLYRHFHVSSRGELLSQCFRFASSPISRLRLLLFPHSDPASS